MRILCDEDMRWVAGGHDSFTCTIENCGHDDDEPPADEGPDSWWENIWEAAGDFLGLDGSLGYDGENDREWVWEGWGDTVNDAIENLEWFADSVMDFFFESAEEHFSRNAENTMPQNRDNLPENAKLMSPGKSVAHTGSIYGDQIDKYVLPDGREGVYSRQTGELITSAEAMGTFNRADPYTDPLGHFWKDVVPWIIYGNSASDTSTMAQRIDWIT